MSVFGKREGGGILTSGLQGEKKRRRGTGRDGRRNKRGNKERARESDGHQIVPLTSRAAAIIKLSGALAAPLKVRRGSTIKMASYERDVFQPGGVGPGFRLFESCVHYRTQFDVFFFRCEI